MEDLANNTPKYYEFTAACFCYESKNGKSQQKEAAVQRNRAARTDEIQQEKDLLKYYEITTLPPVTKSLFVA